jgi:hypothetical protein
MGNSRKLFGLVMGLALAVALVLPVAASGPDASSPSSAAPLAPSASGSIVGNAAGSFAFYTFEYPGDASTGTLSVDFASTEPTTVSAFGVNLYQNGVKLNSMNGSGSRPGTNSMLFYSDQAGPVLAQVFNYAAAVSVSYNLTVSGVKQAVAVVVPTPAPAPAGSPANPYAEPRTMSGSLPGNVAGSYVYYTIDSVGDGSTQTLTLDLAPKSPDITRAITVAVYQDGTLLAKDDASHASTPGHLVLPYVSSKSGPVLVQIGNYNMWTTIEYVLSR